MTVERRVADSRDPVRLGGVGHALREQLQPLLESEVRATVLGHVQRGGTPTPFDRVLATQFGNEAAQLVMAGQFNRMVTLQGERLASLPLAGGRASVAPGAARPSSAAHGQADRGLAGRGLKPVLSCASQPGQHLDPGQPRGGTAARRHRAPGRDRPRTWPFRPGCAADRPGGSSPPAAGADPRSRSRAPGRAACPAAAWPAPRHRAGSEWASRVCAAKRPSARTKRGCSSSIWRSSQGSHCAISTGSGLRLCGGRHLITLAI